MWGVLEQVAGRSWNRRAGGGLVLLCWWASIRWRRAGVSEVCTFGVHHLLLTGCAVEVGAEAGQAVMLFAASPPIHVYQSVNLLLRRRFDERFGGRQQRACRRDAAGAKDLAGGRIEREESLGQTAGQAVANTVISRQVAKRSCRIVRYSEALSRWRRGRNRLQQTRTNAERNR
jgi:hypothetical protein